MGISPYPRSGHRIAPQVLREILNVPMPHDLGVRVSQITKLCDLDETVWESLDADVCYKLAEAVVAQLRLSFPILRETLWDQRLPLPVGGVELHHLELETRTYNCLEHEGFGEHPEYFGTYTIGNLLAVKNFGVKSLVDLLSSLEAVNPADLTKALPESVTEFNQEVSLETLQTLRRRCEGKVLTLPRRMHDQYLPKLPDGIKLDDL